MVRNGKNFIPLYSNIQEEPRNIEIQVTLL